MVAKAKIQALKRNLRFWTMWIHHHELESFPIIKRYSDENSGDVN